MKTCVKRKSIFLLAALCLALVTGGCGSKSDSSQPEPAQMHDYNGAADMMVTEEAAESGMSGGSAVMESRGMDPGAVTDSAYESRTDTKAATGRKLIKTVNLSVETKEYDSVLAAVERQVEELGGYIESRESYNGSSYYGYNNTRNSSLTLRIPEDSLEDFLDTVSTICNVVRRSENVEDVTLKYVDLESHREVLRTEQERLLEFLKQAENMEDVIAIEQRLSEVQYQLESMESQLRTYDNRIDYSTVYLYVDEVEVFTPVRDETVWERVTGGFVDSLKRVSSGLLDFVVWFLTSIPYLLVWAAVAIVLIFFVRKMMRRLSEQKKSKQAQISKLEAHSAMQAGTDETTGDK